MEIKNAYKQKMATQLNEWSAKIDLWEAQVKNTGADVELKRAKELHELREKINLASKKMNEFEKTSAETWDAVKVAADKIWGDIKVGVADVQAKFK